MTSYYGYDQHPDAMEGRPWWRRAASGYRRSDGRAARQQVVEHDVVEKKGRAVILYGARTRHRSNEEVLEEVARIDREHPLPAPEPKCLQTWITPSGDHHVAVGVKDGKAVFLAAVAGEQFEVVGHGALPVWPVYVFVAEEWPPPGAVLVAGPGAPWADTREGG